MTSTDMRPPLPAVPPASPPTPARTPGSDLARPAASRPRWARPAYVVLLLATAALYLVDLGANGWGNSFYAAAAQAGSESWSAFFYGASDAAGSITVDKTPLSLWPMALSVRLFGLSSWSLLVPQALMGVATVALLHRGRAAHHRLRRGRPARRRDDGADPGGRADVPLRQPRRPADPAPDGLGVGDAARGRGRRPWRPVDRAAGALARARRRAGRAGLPDQDAAGFLVLPALALVYLLLAGVPLVRRLAHLLVAFGAMVVAGGWWVAVVELVPAGSRPYVGGSQGDSILELTLGYNGLGRLTGDETGSVGGGGRVGPDRAAAPLRRRERRPGLLAGPGRAAARPHRPRLHPAPPAGPRRGPAVARLAPGHRADLQPDGRHLPRLLQRGAGAGRRGAGRHRRAGRCGGRRTRTASALLGLAVAATASWAFVLLGRSADFLPWLRWVVLVGGLLAAVGLAVRSGSCRGSWWPRRSPSRSWRTWAARRRTPWTPPRHRTPAPSRAPGPRSPAGWAAPAGCAGCRRAVRAGCPGAAGGTRATLPGPAPDRRGPGGPAPVTRRRAGRRVAGAACSRPPSPSAALTAMLAEDADDYTWVAATVGAKNASGYQLATERAGDADRRLQRLRPEPDAGAVPAVVADGEVHWFIGSASGDGGRRRRRRASASSREITTGSRRPSPRPPSTAPRSTTSRRAHGVDGRDLHGARPAAERGRGRQAVLDVVIPVLRRGGAARRRACDGSWSTCAAMPWSFTVTVADNASTDRTPRDRADAGRGVPGGPPVRLERAGPRTGAAPRVDRLRERRCWSTWTSTSPPTSTRCCRWSRRWSAGTPTWRSAPGWRRGSRVERGPRREVISRCYNVILRGTLRARFSDAQCGFKADPSRRRARAAAAGEDDGLVLRHRAAGAGRAGRAAHPRGAGGLARRPREQRRRVAHRARRPARDRLASAAPCCAAGCRCARSAERWDVPAPTPDAGGWAARSRCSWSSACSRRWRTRCSTSCCAGLPDLRRRTCCALLAPRWPTPRPTGGSPSGSAGADGRCSHQAGGLVVFGAGLAVTHRALRRCHAVAGSARRWRRWC